MESDSEHGMIEDLDEVSSLSSDDGSDWEVPQLAPRLRPEKWTPKVTWKDRTSKKRIFQEDEELEEASTSEEESFHSHRKVKME